MEEEMKNDCLSNRFESVKNYKEGLNLDFFKGKVFDSVYELWDEIPQHLFVKKKNYILQ